eukprot:15349671-Ditylum_brightwellii.AAC.1
MSSFNCCPREGHLDAVYNIFAYLSNHENCKLVFDSHKVKVSDSKFTSKDWTSLYRNVKEEIQMNRSEPHGRFVRITAFCDTDHAGNLITRRSHTEILMFLNNSLIGWYSKVQATVQSSTFGSETKAMRIYIDKVQAFRYKLYMMGVPIDGPVDIYCDNNSVVLTAQNPETR